MGLFSSPPAPAATSLSLPVTSATAGIAGFILIALSVNVIKERRSKQIAYGDGGDGSPLQKKIRAHANFVEYTPTAILLVALLEAQGALPRPTVAAAAGLFLLARALHASNMAYGGAFANRVRGTGGTFMTLAFLSACNLYAAAKGAF